MRKYILNISEVELQPRPPQLAPKGAAAQRFDARTGSIADKLGAKKLGYNLTALPPGKRAFPFHNHLVNEEMFFIVEGAGELRMGGETFPIRAGDVIGCPPGGQELAHQIVNTGPGELKYLAVSTKEETDVCEYPDSKKVGVLGGRFRFLGSEDHQPGYWDGE
jgi:uncharacterized cupin superfamily protein